MILELEFKESAEEKKRNDDMLKAIQDIRDSLQGILGELKLHRLPAVKGIVQLGKPVEQ